MMDKKLWKELNNMLENSKSNIKHIGGDPSIGFSAVEELKLNENTTLATIILYVAGLTINKCLRILGQGNDELQGICQVNEVKNGTPTKIKGFLIVATDIFGGIYAMNIDEIDGKVGQIFYFAPDTLEWESLEMKYSQFLYWAVNGNTEEFYSSMKWSDWEKYADETGFDQGILIYPFLWSKEIEIESATKKIVPFVELINVNMDFRRKFFE